MAAVNFPNNPSVNDTHTSSGSTWKWDGTVWQRLGEAGPQGAQGVQGAAGAAGAQGAAGTGTGTADKIFEGNTNVEVVDTGSDGAIKFVTEGTEKVRIRTDGNLGLGIDNPLTKIHAYASAPTITFRDLNANATFVGGAAASLTWAYTAEGIVTVMHKYKLEAAIPIAIIAFIGMAFLHMRSTKIRRQAELFSPGHGQSPGRK